MIAQKILLIENDYCLRKSLFMMLIAEGFDVVAAEDGSIGVNLALTENPDLVICDLRMPRLSGDRVLDILLHDPKTQRTPFICISSETQERAPSPINDLCPSNYLQKPFSRVDLLYAIDYQLCPLLAAG